VFTARYTLSPYIKLTWLVFKRLKHLGFGWLMVDFITITLTLSFVVMV
jgi:hypothetical protein